MKKTSSFTVLPEHTAEVVGSGGLSVLSTPMLLAYMEQVAYLLAEERVNEGESTVGIQVSMDHLAPSPVGAVLEVTTELLAYDGRIFDFAIEAKSEEVLVATASHKRATIQIEKFLSRLNNKKSET